MKCFVVALCVTIIAGWRRCMLRKIDRFFTRLGEALRWMSDKERD